MGYASAQEMSGLNRANQLVSGPPSNKAGGIGMSLEYQAKAVACLGEAVGRLAEMLQSVMLPDAPVSNAEQGLRQQTCDVAGLIHKHTDQISQINGVIDNLINRLNL